MARVWWSIPCSQRWWSSFGPSLSWKVRSARDRSIRTFQIRVRSKFFQNRGDFARIHQKSKKFRNVQHFLQIFGEIPRNFHQNLSKIQWKWSNFANFAEHAKIKIDEILLKYWLSGAKACKSCRSRHELSNEYFVAKFGVDTEENEPCKVCSFGWKIRERFDIEPFN